jgi:hypothetical protein
MQLVEVDDAHGVSAAVTTFTSESSSVQFVLVPVLPLGVPAHYDAVRERLRSCDLVVTMPRETESSRATGVSGPERGSQWERIARGRHIRLITPPDVWNGTDRPFVTPPVVATHAAAQGVRPARRSRLLVALAPLRPLMAMVFARFGTRATVAQMLAQHASEALSQPLDRAFSPTFDWEPRYQLDAEQLAETVRRVHAESQAPGMRVAVVHWVGVLPAIARTLGALGYSAGDVEWITVFPWLADDA